MNIVMLYIILIIFKMKIYMIKAEQNIARENLTEDEIGQKKMMIMIKMMACFVVGLFGAIKILQYYWIFALLFCYPII